jgi:hypothetical protein
MLTDPLAMATVQGKSLLHEISPRGRATTRPPAKWKPLLPQTEMADAALGSCKNDGFLSSFRDSREAVRVEIRTIAGRKQNHGAGPILCFFRARENPPGASWDSWFLGVFSRFANSLLALVRREGPRAAIPSLSTSVRPGTPTIHVPGAEVRSTGRESQA